MDKMLSRAREKDPDKQLYNESMCSKIEALAQNYALACEEIEVKKSRATLRYTAVLKEAESLAFWKQQQQHSLDDVIFRESAERLLGMNEYAESKAEIEVWALCLFESVLRARVEVANDAESEVIWKCASECQRVISVREQCRSNSAIVHFVALMRPLLSESGRRNLVRLCDALISTPELTSIRTIRSSGVNFSSDFGSEGSEIRSAPESILFALRYSVEYHLGERRLILHEPSPEEEPEKWIQWFEEVTLVVAQLR